MIDRADWPARPPRRGTPEWEAWRDQDRLDEKAEAFDVLAERPAAWVTQRHLA